MRSLLLMTVMALAACKPPPTDADIARDMPEEEPTFASDPLPSPETEGAVWARSVQSRGRIVYGIPGQPALVTLDCIDAEEDKPQLRITRLAPADENASALLALVGNGHIGRIPVEQRMVNGRSAWQGEAIADDIVWEPLAGPRSLGVTVPGAGRVEINPGELAGEFIEACRALESDESPLEPQD